MSNLFCRFLFSCSIQICKFSNISPFCIIYSLCIHCVKAFVEYLNMNWWTSGYLTNSRRQQWSVDSDVVTLRPKLLQRHLLNTPAGRHLRRSDWIVADCLKRAGGIDIHLYFINNLSPSTERTGYTALSFLNSFLTLMPNDCILDATSFPILPSPTIPSTLPYSSAPMNCKIRNKTLTLVSEIQKLQESHQIRDEWPNNGADHTAVVALCARTKHSRSTSTNWSVCSPFCDPSFPASLI